MAQDCIAATSPAEGETDRAKKGLTILEASLIGLMVMIITAGTLLMWSVQKDNMDRNRAVEHAVSDTAYAALAAKAGYRVETQWGGGILNRTAWIVARCVRANEAGPLPCEPAPVPPGKAGADMQVIPPVPLAVGTDPRG